MALNSVRFTFPRVLKSTLIAVGLVVASVSLWNPQLLDDFPLCMASYGFWPFFLLAGLSAGLPMPILCTARRA